MKPQFVRPPFQRPPQPPFPPAFPNGGGAGVVQLNSGWEGPAPALGTPVPAFNSMQSEVVGVPVTHFNGAAAAVAMSNQPWAGPAPDSVPYRDGASPQQVGSHPFVASHPAVNGHLIFTNDQSRIMHNPMYRSPPNNHQREGHGALPTYGSPILFHSQNSICANKKSPEEQSMKPFEMRQVGLSGHCEQQWPSLNPVNHIHTGVPVGNFSNDSASTRAQQQWPLPEMTNHVFNPIPAGNLHIQSSCILNRPQQLCPFPDSLTPGLKNPPAGNFHCSSPCRPTSAPQNCPLSETSNHMIGMLGGSFLGNPPAVETSNFVDGIPAGNPPNLTLCGPSMIPMKGTNVDDSLMKNEQNNPHQILHIANSVNTLSGCNSPYARKSQCGLGKVFWERSRRNDNGTPYAQARGGGWREKKFSRDSGNRGGGMPLKFGAFDHTSSNKGKLELPKMPPLKYDGDGHTYGASGSLASEQMMCGKRSSLSPTSQRATSTLSKESEEEIQRWREERKRNYPTTQNIQRKAQEALARNLIGELENEDARIRKERLKHILA